MSCCSLHPTRALWAEPTANRLRATVLTTFCEMYSMSLIKEPKDIKINTEGEALSVGYIWSVWLSTSVISTEITQQPKDGSQLHFGSWFPEDESQWLWWFPDFSSSAILRSDFSPIVLKHFTILEWCKLWCRKEDDINDDPLYFSHMP